MKNKKKSRRNNKKQLSSAAIAKKRRVRAARIRLFLFLFITVGSIWGITKLYNSVERLPLVVDAASYVQYANDFVNAEAAEDLENYTADTDFVAEDEEAIAVFQPILGENYPIDMIINSEYALVYDATANQMLFAKNADQKCYPASTTKILTAAVVLEYMGMDSEFTAGDELDFVNPGSSLAYVNKGSRLNTSMIIDGLMLPSGNDAAYTAAANTGRVIAKDNSLSAREAVDVFIDAMNKTARNAGAESSHFANPDGFHDDNHYTTVLDMLKITLYAKEIPELRESVKITGEYVTFLSGERIYWENSNKLIQEYSDCYYTYANGFKTGMTDESGYCVVATAERFGHEIVCIVFGAKASDIRWNDTMALMDKAFVYIKNSGE